jgi:hypothetical protein
MESTKEKRVWHKGPPPHVEWWNASVNRTHIAWRWWDGKRWSWGVDEGSSMSSVRHQSAGRISGKETVEWTDYYPPNARVPRINPAQEAE